MNVVAILGTTISPYLYFWQADEEVEEEIAEGKLKMMGAGRPKITKRDVQRMRQDTAAGMFFSNLVPLASRCSHGRRSRKRSPRSRGRSRFAGGSAILEEIAVAPKQARESIERLFRPFVGRRVEAGEHLLEGAEYLADVSG